ncbi:hypothetical protein C0992_007857 [Termitomyces sp. T32_za158]|nr:hypothetical protein C0992_007857 [Termitomyces sp. T32_za158]
MGLATLLGGNKAVDTELAAIFTAKSVAPKLIAETPTPVPASGSSKQTVQKRKSTSDVVDHIAESKKRVKTSPTKTQKPAKPKVSKAKGKGREVDPVEEDDDETSDLEKAYLDVHKHPCDVDSDDSDCAEAEGLIEHETVTKTKKASRSAPKIKYVPADETPELRDQRTIFVGNLSVEVAQKKVGNISLSIQHTMTLPSQSLHKQLHRHILAQIPTAKIESTRFRSVPFQVPTSTLPADDDSDDLKGKADPHKNASPAAPKPARQHDLDRASTWRSSRSHPDKNGEEAQVQDDEKKKTYLTPNQKKKIAFIKHEFHTDADTVNAYIVFAHPVPAAAAPRPPNLPPLPPVLDPHEAARQAVRACDGTTFMGRVIRVDLVGKKGVPAANADADGGVIGTDPKSSVFVGNLDFASKEEDLRVFFEGVIAAERGAPPAAAPADVGAGADTGAGAREKRDASWVVRVRIVRDRDTQLGKGFAYVQFIDHACVDEVLALEPAQLKFAKRKLRVQRCRTLPGSSASTRQATASQPSGPAATPAAAAPLKRPVPIVVPKGDPALGEKLAHLSKDARKQYKSGDADRVARRLAKKKARMAMAAGDKIKNMGKERVRERVKKKSGDAGKKTINPGTKKGRVRSERSLMKRNGKKTAGSSG